MPERLNLSDILDWSSYKRFKHLQAVADIKVPLLNKSTFKFKRKGHGEYILPSSNPLDFSSFDSSVLEEIWSRLEKTHYDFSSIEQLCTTDLKFEIERTYYALKFWWYTPGPKRYTIEEILRSSLLFGPTYAERLSDEWDYGIRRFFRIPGISTEYTDWDPITNYNELPPIAYLIRWKETSNDIDYMKIPLKEFNIELLDELREEIEESLPETLELPTDVEVLSEVKTSTTFDLDKMKTIPFYQARLTPLGSEFSQIFKARRSIIPIGPTNTRDAVVTTIDTYNSIKWCDLVIGTLLDNEDESLISSNPQIFQRRLKGMTQIPRRGELFWLRDIKKCGLTFPRELFHLVQDCLIRKYPDKDFSRFNIYRYYNIWDNDNKKVETVRGYCLGMANNLVTYIQCMISKILLKRIPPFIKVKALYGNDDSCLKIWAENSLVDHIDALMIQETDYEILDGLNIITNDKKSFWSWYPILFEEYGHQDFKVKHSRIACALSSAMLAPDIKYAKFLTSSLSLALWDNGSWIESPLRELISRWGYEYFSDEINYDFTAGGWVSIRNKGCNLLLRQIDAAPDDRIPAIWRAMNEVSRFQKEAIRPVLSGSVTKNFSVTGSILNITYVDTELYDVPELPIETLYLDRDGYRRFYESIYRFNRYPWKEMARRLRRVTSVQPGRCLDRRCLQEFALRNFNKLAIPQSLVISDTPVYEIRKDQNLDCSSLMRNSLSRYLMELKDNHILMCPDLEVPPSGEYPYVVSYDSTPYTERIYGVTSLDGEIPDGTYQYSTNPWLPLYEYTEAYDRFPMALDRVIEDRKHLPEWFMNESFRNSHEVSVCYQMIEYGEFAMKDILETIRECHQDELPPEEKKSFQPEICDMCVMGWTGLDTETGVYTINNGDCTLCILQSELNRALRRAQSADSRSSRIDSFNLIAPLRSRIMFLIKNYFPTLTEISFRYTQEEDPNENCLFAGDDDEEILMDMFGGL